VLKAVAANTVARVVKIFDIFWYLFISIFLIIIMNNLTVVYV
jgi:hypothetical protein